MNVLAQVLSEVAVPNLHKEVEKKRCEDAMGLVDANVRSSPEDKSTTDYQPNREDAPTWVE